MKTKILLLLLTFLVINCTKKLEEPDVLYQKALKQAYKGNFETASKYLNDIDENYPYTEYAKNATILLAYVMYKREEYSELLSVIDIFIKTTPKDEAVPYLLYIKGMSFYNQIKNYKKDKQILYEFLEVNAILSSSFKETIYAKIIAKKSEIAMKLIEAGELDVAIQYQKHGNCISSVERYLAILPALEWKNREIAINNLKLCFDVLGIKDYKL